MSGRVPHASLVGVALNLVAVLGEATFNALSFNDGAGRIGGALGVVEETTSGFAGAVVAAPAALRAVGAESGVGDGRAGSNTNANLSVPRAFGVHVAGVLSEVTEVALLLAEGAVPHAHGFEVADGRDGDAGAGVLARSRSTVPHAFVVVVVGDADGVDHLRALEVAGVVDGVPLAEGVGVALGLAFGGGLVVHVVGASVFAELGVLIPLASVVVGEGFASHFVGGAVDALLLAGLVGISTGHPLAELGGEAESLGAEEGTAQSSAGVVDGVPAAFGVGGAGVVDLMAVLAELLALVAGGSGVTAEEVGLAGGGVEVGASGDALGVGVVPHAPLVGLAGIGSGVEDDALLAARWGAFTKPLASGVSGASGGHGVLVAGLAAGAARSVPIAKPFLVAIDVDGVGVAGLLAGVGLGVEHTFGVSGASDGVVGVFDVAASLASLADLVEGAHRGLVDALGHCHERAVLLALANNGIKVALGEDVAAFGCVAARFAGLLASVGGGVEDARRLLFAGSLSRSRAERIADRGGGVPLAESVGVAGFEGRIAVGALSLAELLSVIPFAGSGESTFGLGAEETALDGALVAVGVPEAVGVGVATCGFDVGIAAGRNANVGGVEPHAARDRSALSRRRKRRSFVGDASA